MNRSQIKRISSPVPGSSLTDEPGAAKWEQPPQYAEVNDAIASVLNGITKPDNFAQFLDQLDRGVEIEAMVRTIVLGGFSEGKWTPDVGMLMAETLTNMLSVFAYQNGYENHPVKIPRKSAGELEGMAEVAVDEAEAQDVAVDTVEEGVEDSLISRPDIGGEVL